MMLVESLVFRRDQRLDDMRRYRVVIDIGPVFNKIFSKDLPLSSNSTEDTGF
jgi:hypothetical protein